MEEAECATLRVLLNVRQLLLSVCVAMTTTARAQP